MCECCEKWCSRECCIASLPGAVSEIKKCRVISGMDGRIRIECGVMKAMKQLPDRQLDTKLLVRRHNVCQGSIFYKAHTRTAWKAAERIGGHT